MTRFPNNVNLAQLQLYRNKQTHTVWSSGTEAREACLGEGLQACGLCPGLPPLHEVLSIAAFMRARERPQTPKTVPCLFHCHWAFSSYSFSTSHFLHASQSRILKAIRKTNNYKNKLQFSYLEKLQIFKPKPRLEILPYILFLVSVSVQVWIWVYVQIDLFICPIMIHGNRIVHYSL